MIARADALPRSRPRPNPLVQLFSSVWFGIILLTLILIYACVFSAVPQVRKALEMNDMDAFGHWVFVTLIVLFVVTLSVTTWRRIRWNVTNLGVLTVHTGLLMLTLGSVYYFGTKIEGDVFLSSPRIEIIAQSGQGARVIDHFLAARDASWSNTMPAFGGQVVLSVLDTSGSERQPVTAATLRARVGEAEPTEHRLTNGAGVMVTDRLGVRLSAAPPATKFYDRFTAALFYRRPSDAGARFVPLPGLPRHRERFDAGERVTDTSGQPVSSFRSRPALNLGPLAIPTGWYEPWRLPLRPSVPELPFDVTVTGYLPYVNMVDQAVEGAGDDPPGANVTLSVPGTSIARTVFATPKDAVLNTLVPIEFRWADQEAQREEWARPMAGPHELTIEVKDAGVTRTVAIAQGQTIAVEGTPYVLTIDNLMPDWPLMTPGFEGAHSPVALVKVSNGQKSYQRTVVQRYPELSQDIDETGMRRKDGPYDPNLVLRYRTCAGGWLTLAAGPDVCRTCPPTLIYHDPTGQAQVLELPVGASRTLPLAGMDVAISLTELYRHATTGQTPLVVPIEARRPDTERQTSAIRLKLTGRGEHADWSMQAWVPQSLYPDSGAPALTVRYPGDPGAWELLYSRVEHDLGGTLALRRLSTKFHPGREVATRWRSDVMAFPNGASGPVEGYAETNDTFYFGKSWIGGWTLFQSSAPKNDDWSWSILGVGNRNGIVPMVAGSVLITLGALYAFYVKPVLIRRRKQAALAGAAQPDRRARASRELAEVGT